MRKGISSAVSGILGVIVLLIVGIAVLNYILYAYKAQISTNTEDTDKKKAILKIESVIVNGTSIEFNLTCIAGDDLITKSMMIIVDYNSSQTLQRVTKVLSPQNWSITRVIIGNTSYKPLTDVIEIYQGVIVEINASITEAPSPGEPVIIRVVTMNGNDATVAVTP